MAKQQDTMNSSLLQIAVLSTFSFMGGYGDTSGFLLSGSFTGHITGNVVLAAVSLVKGDVEMLGSRLLAIACFLVATAAGLLLTQSKRVGSSALLLALALEAILIFAAPAGVLRSQPHAGMFLIVSLCLAFGLHNGVYRKALGLGIHTMYITGDMTTLLLSLLSRNESADLQSTKKPVGIKVFGIIWLAFGAGAMAAGVAVHYVSVHAVWLLEVQIALAALLAWRLQRRHASL